MPRSGHSPAEVVGWAVQHEGTLRPAVFIDLFNHFLAVVLVVLWVALGDRQSLVAPLAYLSLGVSSAVWIDVLGLLYALPELVRRDRASRLATASGSVDLSPWSAASRHPGRVRLVGLPPASVSHRRPAIR
jgi:ABC-type nickel/cobalt efflux system permease component RcnA